MSAIKLCPYCGEAIKAIAVKCRFCGTSLSSSQGPSTALSGLDLVKKALGDRYELHEEIGRGGMATVYSATQKNLNRPVALKVVHQNLLHDKEFLNRFHQEAQLCAALSNPNIITIYDEGEVLGVHYMAMEYLDGIDLRQFIHQYGPLSPEQCLNYMLPVAEALAYAHEQGYVHRDIKSSNIFVTQSDRVVLMDFGIAHASKGAPLTQDGAILGTPEYMSSEQASGGKIDHRTDLYSLGVVMFECLTGQVPFQGDSAVSTLLKITNEKPDKGKLRRVPEDFQKLIIKLLNKNPAKRYDSAHDVADRIRQLLKVIYSQAAVSNGPNARRKKHKKPKAKVSGAGAKPKIIHKEIPYVVWVLLVIGVGLATALIVMRHDGREETAQTTEDDWMPFEITEPQPGLSDTEIITPVGDISEIFANQMILVGEGDFMMGCTEEQGHHCLDWEKPAHRVSLNAFYIGRFPVTQKQWYDVMGYNPSGNAGCDDCPVENISWNEVQEYIAKLNKITGLGFRLPTEAEWEFAARGGSLSKGYRYAGGNAIFELAWYGGNSGGRTMPVGKMAPNELGLFDMSGNVMEWCHDWFGPYTAHPTSNPHGPSNGVMRVVRGSHWASERHSGRVSDRSRRSPDAPSIYIGFRLARDM